jgi:crotonobetainyl-CoA:carnitine CoA-transferase CaiB-like acyl-CoA transferase
VSAGIEGREGVPMAFPCDRLQMRDGVHTSIGMTLRDYFAAKASHSDILDYMYERDNTGNPYVIGMKQIRTREEAKYAYADAMLKAREA